MVSQSSVLFVVPEQHSSSGTTKRTWTLGKLNLFSTGDMADKSLAGRYDTPLTGCEAVIHAATPLSPKLAPGTEFDGERDMLNPGTGGLMKS